MFWIIYTILAVCLITWFLITDRKDFNLGWCIAICIGLYVFMPVILVAAAVYLLLYVSGKMNDE